jgi:uncharacterized protein involved in exopolysaccharide biosynthesis
MSQTIEVKSLIGVLCKRKLIACGLFILVALAGLLSVATRRPVYEAVSVLEMGRSSSMSVLDLSGPVVPVELARAYIGEGAFQRKVAGGLAKGSGAARPLPEVRAEAIPEANAVRIRVKSADPQLAFELANRLADQAQADLTGLARERLTWAEKRAAALRDERDWLRREVTTAAARKDLTASSLYLLQDSYRGKELSDLEAKLAGSLPRVFSRCPAAPTSPVGPTAAQTMAYAVAIGLLAGVLGAVAAEYLRP